MNQAALACLLLSLSLVFSGCLSFGDDTEEDTDGTTGDTGDWDVFSIASVTSLPPCDSVTFGRLYYVEDDENFQVCKTNGWEIIDIGSVGNINDPGNNAPLVTAEVISPVNEDYSTNSSQDYFVRWSAIDVDGTISSAGFDIDLDMIIDVPVSKDSGIYTLSIPLDQGWTSDRFVYEAYAAVGYSPCSLAMHRTIAFIAEDDDGAVSAELAQAYDSYSLTYLDNDTIERLNVPQADVDWLMSAECSDGVVEPPDVPFVYLLSTVNSNGEYTITVYSVSASHDLEDFSYFLKDGSGSTNEFGEIAMQNLSGGIDVSGFVVGIDASYGDKCGGDFQPACETDLSTRADAVGGDSGSNYAVAFYDNDREGKLSTGDFFIVRGSHGSGADGPAQDDWTLEIKFDNTGDVVGSKQLG
jgi:hypothetical protein